jgi:hypothetical protein
MSTAEELASHLGTVADDSAVTVLTYRGERLNGALEAVKGVPRASSNHLETFVIVISTNFTASHCVPSKAEFVFGRL